METAAFLEKVTAFVTRQGTTETEMLLFEHPNAGVQFPAGTVEEQEPIEAAAFREIYEETGLQNVRLIRHIGWRDELPPNATHVVLHTTTVYARPDPTSFDWAKIPRGAAVRMLRGNASYAHITYEEGDRYPDPTYISYQITGWVPNTALAAANRRHFFHFEITKDTPPGWIQHADNHIFRLFWAPLSSLPAQPLVQRPWLDFVIQELGYQF